MTADTTAQVPLRRVTGMIRQTCGRPALVSRTAYTNRERRAQREQAFNVAATLELHLKSPPTKNAMLTLLHTWLYAADQCELATRQPDYVHGLRYAIDVMAEALSPKDAIEILRETEPNVRFIVAPPTGIDPENVVGREKESRKDRFIFERRDRSWLWKCVDENRQLVRSSDRSFAYYLDAYVDAKLHGFTGGPFRVLPSEEVVSPAMRMGE